MASQAIIQTLIGPRGSSVAGTPRAFRPTAIKREVAPCTVPLPMLHDPMSQAATSFRVLAHRLRRAGHPRVIAVTSARRGEGKTSCAANLALAMAEQGRTPVLLVEANRLRPRFSTMFDYEVQACFEAQLMQATKRDEGEWFTVTVEHENLHALAVDPETATGRPVSPRSYRCLIEQARPRFGYVIIDCPSVTEGGDVGIIEDLSDGVLFAALAGVTRRRHVREALEQLAPASFLGLVLLGSKV